MLSVKEQLSRRGRASELGQPAMLLAQRRHEAEHSSVTVNAVPICIGSSSIGSSNCRSRSGSTSCRTSRTSRSSSLQLLLDERFREGVQCDVPLAIGKLSDVGGQFSLSPACSASPQQQEAEDCFTAWTLVFASIHERCPVTTHNIVGDAGQRFVDILELYGLPVRPWNALPPPYLLAFPAVQIQIQCIEDRVALVVEATLSSRPHSVPAFVFSLCSFSSLSLCSVSARETELQDRLLDQENLNIFKCFLARLEEAQCISQ